jgi:hypothetical protein
VTSFAKRSLAACGIATVVETVLLLQIAEPVLLLFVLGPLLFLAVIVWRRRTHLPRSQRLAGLSLGISTFGIVALAVDWFYPRKNPDQPTIAPLFVPLTQWLTILFVWFKMVREESREKREKLPPLS